MNIAKHLERGAAFFPDRPAVSESEKVITYKQLNSWADSAAASLEQMGVETGGRIGLCLPNSAQWLALYFGAMKLGATAVTFPYQAKGEELNALIDYSRPLVLFTTQDKKASLAQIQGKGFLQEVLGPEDLMDWDSALAGDEKPFKTKELDPDDTAAILFTGGTTGISKGVLLTHENITVSSCNVSYCERSNQYDRALCFLPFNHVFGQIHIMNATIFSGGSLELLPHFDLDKVLETTALGGVTKFYAVPTVYVRLLGLEGLKERTKGVRYCFSAAASLAAEIVREWQSATGLVIHEGYGLTETASAVTYNHMIRHRIGSVGHEVPGVDVQIRDLEGMPLEQGKEGEICIRGRNVMRGYLDQPEETRRVFWETSWLRSGDIGFFDEDGYLYIVDRLKDMIITGGENVYPREVEELLFTRSEVMECAVVGTLDREWGERVTAFVVPRPGFKVIPEELKTFLKARLAPYKIPKEFIVVGEIPKNSAGKPLKRELRKAYSGSI